MSFDIDVRLRRGEREIACAFRSDVPATVLVGPSGAGKTSVLHAVAGLLRPEEGRIAVGGVELFAPGVDVPAELRRAGYVFQDTRLFPHLSVRRNLLYGFGWPAAPGEPLPFRGGIGVIAAAAKLIPPGEPLPFRGRIGVGPLNERPAGGTAPPPAPRLKGRGEESEHALQQVAAMLDIADLLDRRPATLSGGEARRVAIGRALLMRPAFLLLDEPTVSLDAARREEVLRAVERARDAAGVPVLMVTHDEAEAERVGAVVRMS